VVVSAYLQKSRPATHEQLEPCQQPAAWQGPESSDVWGEKHLPPNKACNNDQCSGLPHGFEGQVSSDTSLQAAADARSLEGELVLVSMSDGGASVALAVNLLLNLEELGIKHHLLLAVSKEECQGLRKASRDLSFITHNSSVGCAWSGATGGLSFTSAATRIAQLGVNVLALQPNCRVTPDIYSKLNGTSSLRHHSIVLSSAHQITADGSQLNSLISGPGATRRVSAMYVRSSHADQGSRAVGSSLGTSTQPPAETEPLLEAPSWLFSTWKAEALHGWGLDLNSAILRVLIICFCSTVGSHL